MSVRVPLSSICEQDRSAVLPDSEAAARLRYVGMEHVESGTGIISLHVPTTQPITGQCFRFDSRHVIYGKLRPYLNKVAVPDFEGRCSTELIPLLPADGVDRTYLAYTLRHPATVDAAMGEKTGSRMPRADMTALMRQNVALPPLIQQREIVAQLDAQMAAAAHARAAVAAQLVDAERLMQRWIDDRFTATAQSGAAAMRLEAAAEIQAGVTLGKDYPPSDTITVPYLRVANVKDGRLDLSDVKSIAVPQKVVDALTLRFGDMLLTEGGDPDKVGRGTLWQNELPTCIHQNHIFRVRFDLTLFDPVYLALQFRSAYAKTYFLAHAKQTTGIASINQQVLRAYPILCAPLVDQRALVAAYTKLSAPADRALTALRQRLADIDRLPVAFLRAAFEF